MKTPGTFFAFRFALVLLAAGTSSACREHEAPASAKASRAVSSTTAPTIASELTTFRSGMTVRPSSLAGPTSRDSLLGLFERALARRDSATLRQLQISKEEFAYLYYPETKLARSPYELGPDVMWMQIESQSDRGLRRLIAKYAGPRFAMRRIDCQSPERENAILIHQCTVRVDGEADGARQLFGSIVERSGHFKFVGYANRL